MALANGTNATFRQDGRVASIHAGGTHIERGFHGERHIVTQHGTYRVVSMGRNRGYLERPYFNRNGRAYIQRTYVVNGVAYTRVYRSYAYGGVTYYRYTPVVYYRPAFYGWAYNPWPAPVHYTWGWAGDPWYGYYGPYFAPYPAYPTASLWLTDFLLAENLQAAYEARAQANAAQAQGENYAPAEGQGENYPPPSEPAAANQNAVQMTPEVKQMIAEEVKRQLAAQQASAASPPQATPAGPAPSGADAEVPEALDPADRSFVVFRSLAVTTTEGQECGLTSGDVLMRLTDSPDVNQNVNASVQASMGSDCASGKTVAIGVQDLQEMHNHFREQLDSGLKTLASKSGKGGLPRAPDTSTTSGEVPPPAPDANVQTLLAAQQKDADQVEAQLQQAAGQGTQNNQ
jgi:hypothetical protein